jgi:hypothetical protein
LRTKTERLLSNLRKDTDALTQHGGRDNAIAAGYKFKAGPDYIRDQSSTRMERLKSP